MHPHCPDKVNALLGHPPDDLNQLLAEARSEGQRLQRFAAGIVP